MAVRNVGMTVWWFFALLVIPVETGIYFQGADTKRYGGQKTE